MDPGIRPNRPCVQIPTEVSMSDSGRRRRGGGHVLRLITRRTGMVLALGAGSVLLLGTVKAKQIQTMMAQASSFQPPPEAVTTVVAREERWPSRLAAIGTVKAERGVTLSADLPGVVEEIRFESGRAVRAGEVLVELDTRQERAQLAAAEAQRELARVNFE